MRILVTLLSFGAAATMATAQPPASHMQLPAQGPTYSPYLNLLRNNAPFYQNYFGLVQPQLQAQEQLQQLQQQLRGMQNTPAAVYPGTGSELFTGKNVGYFTHRSYFMNMSGTGSATTLTGQYGTLGNNTTTNYNRPQAPSPFGNNNAILPGRR